jgi:hypothetical protein
MAERRTIHPPYLVNRLRMTEPDEELLKTDNARMSELHRFLRYLLDAYDNVQSVVAVLTGGGSGGVLTAEQTHAKIMIRVSLDF